MPAELLEQTFVQREQLAERLVSLFEASAEGESRHHVLLVGPRGIGKSHLVALVYHRLRRNSSVRAKLETAWLAEDEWGISSFLDLLAKVLAALGVRTDEIANLTHFDAEKRAAEILSDRIGNKTLLVIVENLDSVLRNLGEAGQKKWRALIQNTGYWAILATAPALSEEVQLQASPFYGFFEIQHLRGLTDEEGIVMLQRLAAAQGKNELAQLLHSPVGRARVRALQHLAQGNHRVLIIFYDFLDEDARQDLLTLLWKTIDALTPYYQSLMKDLSPQQRKLIDFLCRFRVPATVKVIASGCFVSHQTAASQLKQLLEARYVRVERHGRESYYELSEPLLRICVEAKSHSPEPLPLLVELLRYWFSRRELEEHVKTQVHHWGKPYFEAALHKYEEGQGHTHLSLLVRECCGRLRETSLDGKSERSKSAAEELAEIAERDEDWSHYCRALLYLGDIERAMVRIELESRLKPNNPEILKALAEVYLGSGRPEDALEAINLALDFVKDDDTLWAVKGAALEALDQDEAALGAFNEARKLDSVFPGYALCVGRILLNLKRPKETVRILRGMVKRWEATPELLVCFGVGLWTSGRGAEGLSILEEASRKFPNSAYVWMNLANCRNFLGDVEGTRAAVDRVMVLDPHDTQFARRVALILFGLGRYREASERLPVDALAHGIYHELVGELSRPMNGEKIRVVLEKIRSRVPTDAWATALRGGVWEFLSGLASGLGDVSVGDLRALSLAFSDFSASEPGFAVIERFVGVVSRYKESRDQRVLLELPLEQRTLLETRGP
jgi:tetratricopeptide (TPR) repeat protein